MQQRTLVLWLKILVIFVAICGVTLCAGVFPMLGKRLAIAYPELAHGYVPWLTFLWILAVPCFAALVLAWKIFGNIEKDCSFCMENAQYLQKISYLAAADSLVLLLGNLVFFILNMNHPAALLLSVMLVGVGVGISVAAAVLSHLVMKAALLQEQSDLTI